MLYIYIYIYIYISTPISTTEVFVLSNKKWYDAQRYQGPGVVNFDITIC